MRKSIPLTLANLTLASVIAASPIYAAESQPQPVVSVQTEVAPTESKAPIPEVVAPLLVTTDNTNRTVTDGVHLDVLYDVKHLSLSSR
ncbi:hypothetical protein P4H66_30470 [Paenibacillus dokdonensis]|uniref:Uncharacterized protein n=1 Tax=Paenibacillus dokdonensis TaxID=2567944 RepID=A0ABU6GWR5_9BACL|nr:hypothetical protein [Paenibacillus dokdonensis]MEC0244141.1 hypothetical protein [Paenibacillus dokdonensis]